jgi:hypothetical protein
MLNMLGPLQQELPVWHPAILPRLDLLAAPEAGHCLQAPQEAVSVRRGRKAAKGAVQRGDMQQLCVLQRVEIPA